MPDQVARTIWHHWRSRGGHHGSGDIIEVEVEVVGSIGVAVARMSGIELDHFLGILIARVAIGRVNIVCLSIVSVHCDEAGIAHSRVARPKSWESI